MGLKDFYANKVTPWLRCIPGGSRLNAALVAFCADLRATNAPYGVSAGSRFYTDCELKTFLMVWIKGLLNLLNVLCIGNLICRTRVTLYIQNIFLRNKSRMNSEICKKILRKLAKSIGLVRMRSAWSLCIIIMVCGLLRNI